MKVASFFSGIGGFELGLEKAGMEVVFQCEIDRFNHKILQNHWPNVPCHYDIKTLEETCIPESDVWCAGFPCQDVSLANNGKRDGLNGKRSGLFHEFKRIVEQRRPKWVVLENVPGLLSSQKGEDFRTVVGSLDELGYGVAWRIFDAKFFGTPQRRRRVFIVASYQSPCAIEVLFNNERTPVSTSAGESTQQAASNRSGKLDPEAIVYSIQNAAIGRIHTSGPQGKGYRSDGETWTLDSRGRGDVVCSPSCPFGIREVADVPAGLDKRRYRSLGNAVNVAVAEWIGRRILEVEQQQFIHSLSH
ncbi:MAG: DNA (cytosine-5-)-methyltransferase [Chloroflexi bacterium]|nr:DNA (cytosine-5-)-methyltransferase [Chloroflexota bacterium]MBP8055413.1 DNA (cytosine-5-)-methyltransferase [Chloroflexota bacterium]